ncbi:MAG: RNA 2',3'-cyclic phosphodiesterase [Candidatus Glassbacteria bacterium]
MRTFIAVEPPEELREEIGALTDRLNALGLKSFRWVRPLNMHLTLRFLGEIDPGRRSEAEAAVGRAAAGVGPFELAVAEVGYFGPPRQPRVIWLGIEPAEPLIRLAAQVEENLQEAGFGRADKPFRAHLTLARAGRSAGAPPAGGAVKAGAPASWPAWPVTEVHLIKSTLTPQGPIYEILKSCALGS